jgi:ornithine cyclodeaminase
MIHLTDDQIDGALAGADLVGALGRAFAAFARGEAAMQERIRTEAGPVKLSTMGAVWPAEGFAGAKVYTTIAGQFNFVIVLFSATTGEPLATLQANAVTRWRTAAVSVLAARALARPEASALALFGTGVPARAHAQAFARAFALRSVRVVSRSGGEALARELGASLGCEARAAPAREALAGAHLVVTATRSATPLFEGAWVEPGAFVAAVGSSRPDTRELDDALLARSRAVVVEWKRQALREAGDLVMASPAALEGVPVLELGEVLAASSPVRAGPDDIVVFKSVGVGLEDVVVAGLAWQRATGRIPANL